MDKKINELLQLRQEALSGGGFKRMSARRAQGRMNARERVDMLLDAGSFEEFDMLKTHRCQNFGMDTRQYPGDGVVTGFGTIDGRLVFVFSQDATVLGGSLSETFAEKICKVMDMAASAGAPLIGLNDSGGARIQEGIESLAGYAEIFERNVRLSGVVPQLSGIFGPCAGGAVYSPALTDIIMMVRHNSYMFLTGPKVVKAVTYEDITTEELGGADVHTSISGVAHLAYDSEAEIINGLRRVLSYLPQNNLESPPWQNNEDSTEREVLELGQVLPPSVNQPYDMLKVVIPCMDKQSWMELQPDYAPNIITGFARLGGASVGIVANQPQHLAGVLDSDSACKAARFVRMCDAFNIPLLTFVDVPGFMPGRQQEHQGVIRHGAKLLYAYAEATVPKITLIVRKAYGGAYCVMSSKHLRGDVNYAWPSAEIAVMGAKGAAEILYGREAAATDDPQEFLKIKEQEYQDQFANPFVAAQRGYVDDVILPERTRFRLCRALGMLGDKRSERPTRKHGNMPL
ncbi:MAG: acyl-CoA carboxylase subunit beta [Desulfuromonadaceae bacterium]|jgi:propionyl-CoA carboxylase beta chain|nr:acyl-CoA carboxylase subunit beta [Desulfuromonas sp.]MDY0185329.1 acyl-CoA carboxylase subunit beta [Desulfuromonadaceae bacterium]